MSPLRLLLGALGALLLLASDAPAATSTAVIVREGPGAGAAPEAAVQALGGEVRARLPIIGGFAARVPAAEVAALRAAPGVRSVTRDAAVELHDAAWDPSDDPGSLERTVQEVTGAADMWDAGHRGQGVDVALLDSGVTPVRGLDGPGKLVHGPDLSFESQAPALRHLDTFGHGTHMAGIIAGRDPGVPDDVRKGEDDFAGMAPRARIVSLKLADSHGATDVSQVIAAIDWVVQHRRSDGLRIRVLNLSFGTDSTQPADLDPLAYAAEVAWSKGIVVVVAAGNGGFGTAKLNDPAYAPSVIAVGASADVRGTHDAKDDVVPSWSSFGDASRRPDVIAPGQSIVSLRVPGSFLDAEHPGAVVGGRFFRGSGTSQSAAFVSGAAALIVSQRPAITPDGVKALLAETAQALPDADSRGQGSGLIDLGVARDTPTPAVAAAVSTANGTGSLEAARGEAHVVDAGVPLTGERDIFGEPWTADWAPASAAATAWTGGTWRRSLWTGAALGSDGTWEDVLWPRPAWTGAGWGIAAWSGTRWSGSRWSGTRWSGTRWSGTRWSGDAWSSAGWG